MRHDPSDVTDAPRAFGADPGQMFGPPAWLAVLVLCAVGCGDEPCPENTVAIGDRCVVVDGGVVGEDGGGEDGCAPQPFYEDADGDGHGDPAVAMMACSVPAGFVAGDDDCDDADATVYPGATETCNGIDDDCAGGPDDTFECVMGTEQSCTTTCGSIGTAACVAECTLTCEPPPERCNGVDDDCDGRADLDLIVFGPRHDVATTTFQVEVVATADGFVAFYQDGGTIKMRRLEPSGLPAGAQTTVATGTFQDFAAWSTGDTVGVAWSDDADGHAAVYRASDLGVITASTPLLIGPCPGLRGVATTDRLLLVYTNTSADLRYARLAYPELSGSYSDRIDYGVSGQQSLALDDSGHIYLAYGKGGDVLLRTLAIDASELFPMVPVTSDGTTPPDSSPEVAVGMGADGSPRVAVAWAHNPCCATAGDTLGLVVFSAVDGRPTPLSTISTPVGWSQSWGPRLRLVFAGGYWQATWYEDDGVDTGGLALTLWRAGDFFEASDGTLAAGAVAQVEGAVEHAHALAAAPAGTGMLVAGAATDHALHDYLRACP